jgi:hypothetical protein
MPCQGQHQHRPRDIAAGAESDLRQASRVGIVDRVDAPAERLAEQVLRGSTDPALVDVRSGHHRAGLDGSGNADSDG